MKIKVKLYDNRNEWFVEPTGKWFIQKRIFKRNFKFGYWTGAPLSWDEVEKSILVLEVKRDWQSPYLAEESDLAFIDFNECNYTERN